MEDNDGRKIIDITKRKKTEQSLSLREAYLKEFLASKREFAKEKLGEEFIEGIDESVKGFAEEPNDLDVHEVMDFVESIYGKDALKFNDYPLFSYANYRAGFEIPDEGARRADRTEAIYNALSSFLRDERE